MGRPARLPYQDQRRQGPGFIEQKMIWRQHHLLGIKTQVQKQILDRVDRSTVNRGLTGFAKPAIAYGDAKAFKDRLEGGRSAVHL